MGLLNESPYTRYVFENLHLEFKDDYKFVTVTRCPNWNGKEPEVQQEGYLELKSVEAGKDTYFDVNEQKHKLYNYTAIYFLSFVPITHVLSNGSVVASNQIKIS